MSTNRAIAVNPPLGLLRIVVENSFCSDPLIYVERAVLLLIVLECGQAHQLLKCVVLL